MRVSVKFVPAGGKCVLDVRAQDTVQHVKALVFDKEGVPPDRQRVVFRGQLIDDGETLRDRGVDDGALLYCAVALPAAAPPPPPPPAAPAAPAAVRGATWFEAALGFRETAAYAATQRELRARAGTAADGTLTLNGRRVGEWRFDRVADLRAEALALLHSFGTGEGVGEVRVTNTTGDVRALHQRPDLAGALFQAASQFNALEMVGPSVTPEAGITGYEHDRTQGPACATACAAGTAYRNYLVRLPTGKEGQTAPEQLDGLADLAEALRPYDDGRPLWDMQNGYSDSDPARLREIGRRLDAPPGGESRDELLGLVRIGTHFDVDVTAGPAAGTPVGQAYCSAHAVGYSRQSGAREWAPFARFVLEAAYEGTLWAAVLYAARRRRSGALRARERQVVLLTKLGGGVFRNDAGWVAAGIAHALRAVGAAGAALDVRIVHYGHVEQEYLSLGPLDAPPPAARGLW